MKNDLLSHLKGVCTSGTRALIVKKIFLNAKTNSLFIWDLGLIAPRCGDEVIQRQYLVKLQQAFFSSLVKSVLGKGE